MIDGANEKGWVISVDGPSTLDLKDSEIGKLNLDLAAGTDVNGVATFSFTFDDEDRFLTWTITGPGEAEASIDTFDSSPVEMWTSRPPDRVQSNTTGRVTP